MKITPLLFETYISIIKNSVGSKIFQTNVAKVGGKTKDITERGNLSCGFFVTFILKYFDLVKKPHVTVPGTLRDMEESGWGKIKKPRVGCLILWEPLRVPPGKDAHQHLGFYLGGTKAISNSSSKRVPIMHHWTFGAKDGKAKRKIEGFYWHKKLDIRN